jgi:hypothetical protein
MYSFIDYIYGAIIVIIILGVIRFVISVGDEYYIPSSKKKPDDALNGLTKLGRLLYKLKGMNDKKKVRILHPIGFIVFILMMIAAIPFCLFKPFTIFDILSEFTLI